MLLSILSGKHSTNYKNDLCPHRTYTLIEETKNFIIMFLIIPFTENELSNLYKSYKPSFIVFQNTSLIVSQNSEEEAKSQTDCIICKKLGS